MPSELSDVRLDKTRDADLLRRIEVVRAKREHNSAARTVRELLAERLMQLEGLAGQVVETPESQAA